MIRPKSLGPILHAQPEPCESVVNRGGFCGIDPPSLETRTQRTGSQRNRWTKLPDKQAGRQGAGRLNTARMLAAGLLLSLDRHARPP